MKFKVAVIFVVSSLLSLNSYASCGVSNARITDVHQYFDGHVFVAFDKAVDCGCTQTNRLAFNVADPDIEFIQSMVLMAYATGRRVDAKSSSELCSVHGNTAKMDYFRVHPD